MTPREALRGQGGSDARFRTGRPRRGERAIEAARTPPTVPPKIGAVKAYGPYLQRKGARLYWHVLYHMEDGSVVDKHLGPAGDVYDRGAIIVTVQPELEEALVEAYVYARSYRWARVWKPLLRLLRAMGSSRHTDEEVP